MVYYNNDLQQRVNQLLDDTAEGETPILFITRNDLMRLKEMADSKTRTNYALNNDNVVLRRNNVELEQKLIRLRSNEDTLQMLCATGMLFLIINVWYIWYNIICTGVLGMKYADNAECIVIHSFFTGIIPSGVYIVKWSIYILISFISALINFLLTQAVPIPIILGVWVLFRRFNRNEYLY